MPKESWIIANILVVIVLVGVFGFTTYQHKNETEQLKTALAEAQAEGAKSTEQAATQLQNLTEKLSAAQSEIEELQKQQQNTLEKHKNLEEEMRAALESKDVTISQLQGKLTVNILDRVLFDSGEADLKPDGAVVLKKVARILADHAKLKVHVVGHTDNVPIRAGGHSKFISNWELSTARATAAVRFLAENGVDPTRLGALGYGEFRPVASNETSEGRARNRRIAITILSEELAGSDTVATSGTNSLLQLAPAHAATNESVNTKQTGS